MSFSERVNRGAEWLDEIKPGWAGEINVLSLNLQKVTSCVLGQLFRTEAAEERYFSGFDWAKSIHFDGDWYEIEEHGFDLTDEERDNNGGDWTRNYGELTQVWLKAIETRKAAA